MQIQSYDDHVVETSQGFNFKTTDFGVSSPALIFDILCNKMYENPLRTMVQEYMANARDAHREVHNDTTPIDIVLPTPLDPHLRIRDFGPGITPERMDNVFVKLGASTKRADNVQTGGFGVGAKVGWAYSKSFIIESTTAGICRKYLAYLGDGNIGKLSTLSEDPTDAPEGVEIVIKIADMDRRAVEAAVQMTAFFWDVPPVVHNANSKLRWYTGTKKRPAMVNIPDLRGGYVAVVDGIPYSIDSGSAPRVKELYMPYSVERTACFFFDVGEVDVGVNREGLRYTDTTLDNLSLFIDGVEEQMDTRIEAIYKADTFSEKLEAAQAVYKGLCPVKSIVVPYDNPKSKLPIRFRIGFDTVQLVLPNMSRMNDADIDTTAPYKPSVSWDAERATALVSKVRYKRRQDNNVSAISLSLYEMESNYLWLWKAPNVKATPPKHIVNHVLETKRRYKIQMLCVSDERVYTVLRSTGMPCLDDVDIPAPDNSVSYRTFTDEEIKSVHNRNNTITIAQLSPEKHVYCLFKEREDAKYMLQGTPREHKCYYVTQEQYKHIKTTDAVHYTTYVHDRYAHVACLLQDKVNALFTVGGTSLFVQELTNTLQDASLREQCRALRSAMYSVCNLHYATFGTDELCVLLALNHKHALGCAALDQILVTIATVRYYTMHVQPLIDNMQQLTRKVHPRRKRNALCAKTTAWYATVHKDLKKHILSLDEQFMLLQMHSSLLYRIANHKDMEQEVVTYMRTKINK